MHAAHSSWHRFVELDDDLIRQSAESRHVTYAGRGNDLDLVTFFDDVAGFDDGEVRLRHKAIAEVLRQFGEVHVEIVCSLRVEFSTQVFVSLIRCAELDGMCAS